MDHLYANQEIEEGIIIGDEIEVAIEEVAIFNSAIAEYWVFCADAIITCLFVYGRMRLYSKIGACAYIRAKTEKRKRPKIA